MGMAASQARYLALVARKSNCEYEGQQINQSRLLLSNQSANLFNQMLGLKVPIPPSVNDFTKEQYSFVDGGNAATLDSWKQLATPEEDYNYVVNYHYNTNVFTGQEKKLNDPQVQFSIGDDSSVAQIEAAMRLMTSTKAEWDENAAELAKLKAEAAQLQSYAESDPIKNINKVEYSSENDTYTVETKPIKTHTDPETGITYNVFSVTGTSGGEPVTSHECYYKDGNYYSTTGTYSDPIIPSETPTLVYDDDNAKTYNFKGYNSLNDAQKTSLNDALTALNKEGAIDKDTGSSSDMADVYAYFDDNNIYLAFASDLKAAKAGTTTLQYYNASENGTITTKANEYDSRIAQQESLTLQSRASYEAAKAAYDNMTRPTYVGNCKLELLVDLDEQQEAELAQIIKSMASDEIDTNIANCFDADGHYLGGVYQFTLNNVTYYTTYADLEHSYASGSGINNIDGQVKLPYYRADYISTKIDESKKALLETDGSGRFTSVRFEDDTVKYTLNVETITDNEAYQDAMNQFYYDNAVYDKMVQDINAKTSLIQQQDQQLELRLKQLETEQNALSTEIDAVQKVCKENVEKSFKTFAG